MLATKALRFGLALTLACVAACGNPPGIVDTPPPRAVPPPRPGTAITHTRLCACTTCTPAACCQGDSDLDKPPQCADDGSLDFSHKEGCGGLSVQSCVGACAHAVWRVPLSKSCDEKRPARCCANG